MRTMTSGLKWALREMAPVFLSDGWELESLTTSSLALWQRPAEHIRHRLLLIKAPAISGPPPPEFAPVNCFAQIVFEDLERLISQCLGHATDTLLITAQLSLMQSVPRHHLYQDEYHIIDITPDSDGLATRGFLRDYYTYLEVARLRMRGYEVFKDADFTPPRIDYWAWHTSRLAYVRLYEDADTWRQVSSELKAQAMALIDGMDGSDSTTTRVFTNIEHLKRSVTLKGASDMLALIAALDRSLLH